MAIPIRDILNQNYNDYGPEGQESLKQATLSYGRTPQAYSGSGSQETSSDSGKKVEDDKDALKKLKNSISGSYDDIIDTYKSQLKGLPGEQEKLISNVNTMAGTQKSTIQSSLDNILSKLTGQKEEVKVQQKQTLQDLADNTRNMFQAGNVYLGARGAGDSSATGMYSAALTQNANKERAGVQRDVNSMYNEIGTKEADVQTEFQAQLNEVDTWAQTQTQNIVMEYTDLKRQLEQLKANAQGMEKKDLANLEMELYSKAEQQLANVQNSVSQIKQTLNEEVANGSTLGEQGSEAIKTSGAYVVGQVYQPQDVQINWDNLQSTQNGVLDTITGQLWDIKEDGTVIFLGNA